MRSMSTTNPACKDTIAVADATVVIFSAVTQVPK
jgi:hypothetical protein